MPVDTRRYGSLQVGANNVDEVLRGFLGRFRLTGHVITNMVLHEFGHQAVDGAARRRQALQDVGALLVVIQGAQDAFQLADDFFRARDQIEFFTRGGRHFSCIPYGGMV